MPGARRFMIVTMMLIAARIDDTPSKCTAKIANGNASPVCSTSGGYSVQPPAGAPPGRNSVRISKPTANGSSQNDQLLSRGNAMSGAPIISGIIQFAKPANAGMIIANTMTSACTVVIELKNSGRTNCMPGSNSSARITIAMRAADEQHQQAEHQIERADFLVIRRRDPAQAPRDESVRVLLAVMTVAVRVDCSAAHAKSSLRSVACVRCGPAHCGVSALTRARCWLSHAS